MTYMRGYHKTDRVDSRHFCHSSSSFTQSPPHSSGSKISRIYSSLEKFGHPLTDSKSVSLDC